MLLHHFKPIPHCPSYNAMFYKVASGEHSILAWLKSSAFAMHDLMSADILCF